MTISKASEKDANDILKVIEETLVSTHKKLYSPQYIQHTLDIYTEKILHYINSYDYFVAKENGKIIGCVLAKKGYMRSLYILPEYQGRGLGRKLVEIAEECTKKQGYEQISIWASLVSYDFYIHMGYHFTEDIKNEDGIVTHKAMTKDL
ncbi:MAG: GNAT family N-acetyltransferase [Candidatus Dojkabacteria bacterium]|jgi:N-acetylglutamate synthase-like GNAT family acetyltransferase